MLIKLNEYNELHIMLIKGVELMKKYMKVFVIGILILTCLLWLNSQRFEKYTGKSLNIGVIGEIPDVKEKMIAFENLEFNDLEKESELMKYDAIFITEENLQEASKKEYAPVYNKCVVPFFFIKDTKGPIPFIAEEITYEDAEQLSDSPPFATGILKKNGELIFREYGFYNDIENKKHIEEAYSRIFKDIAENKE